MISEYDGNSRDLAKYLFYLKNYNWKKYHNIKTELNLVLLNSTLWAFYTSPLPLLNFFEAISSIKKVCLGIKKI